VTKGLGLRVLGSRVWCLVFDAWGYDLTALSRLCTSARVSGAARRRSRV